MPVSAREEVSLSINPATGETLSTWPMAGAARLEETIARAFRAAASWRNRSLADRAQLMAVVAAKLRARKKALALRVRHITEVLVESQPHAGAAPRIEPA